MRSLSSGLLFIRSVLLICSAFCLSALSADEADGLWGPAYGPDGVDSGGFLPEYKYEVGDGIALFQRISLVESDITLVQMMAYVLEFQDGADMGVELGLYENIGSGLASRPGKKLASGKTNVATLLQENEGGDWAASLVDVEPSLDLPKGVYWIGAQGIKETGFSRVQKARAQPDVVTHVSLSASTSLPESFPDHAANIWRDWETHSIGEQAPLFLVAGSKAGSPPSQDDSNSAPVCGLPHASLYDPRDIFDPAWTPRCQATPANGLATESGQAPFLAQRILVTEAGQLCAVQIRAKLPGNGRHEVRVALYSELNGGPGELVWEGRESLLARGSFGSEESSYDFQWHSISADTSSSSFYFPGGMTEAYWVAVLFETSDEQPLPIQLPLALVELGNHLLHTTLDSFDAPFPRVGPFASAQNASCDIGPDAIPVLWPVSVSVDSTAEIPPSSPAPSGPLGKNHSLRLIFQESRFVQELHIGTAFSSWCHLLAQQVFRIPAQNVRDLKTYQTPTGSSLAIELFLSNVPDGLALDLARELVQASLAEAAEIAGQVDFKLGTSVDILDEEDPWPVAPTRSPTTSFARPTCNIGSCFLVWVSLLLISTL